MNYNFKNKRVWITGASSGIGFSLAQKLLDEGATVVVTARNEKKLQEEFSDYKKAIVVSGDITSIEVNQSIVEKITEAIDGLDCVIFNAGNAEYIDINNFSAKPFENMMQINFLSMVKGIECVLPILRQSKSPYLVGMSSSVAWQGLPQGQAYSASKAAIRNLFQGLGIELAQENIAVSWICPGFVKTPLTDKNTFAMPSRIDSQEAANRIFKGLSNMKTEIHFPKRFTFILKLMGCLPAGLSRKLLKGTVPAK